MVKRNGNFTTLQKGYLFVEIEKRKQKFREANPKAQLISLGVGDTSEPITPTICKALCDEAKGLGTIEGYSGYPAFNGPADLRQKIAQLYNGKVEADEIFVSDGSKPDLGRIQFAFPPSATAAVQDPVYPAYVDGLVIAGKGGAFNTETGRYERIQYMPCLPENNFFPDLETTPRTDIIYFCSPNNPTGSVATREQLEMLVKFATKNKSIILFDSAYREYIKDPSLPKSIFEIEGAREVAMETASFSKLIGYTGVRLGWTVVPKDLKFEDEGSLHEDWSRIAGTLFNGPSNIASAGGLAALSEMGLKEMAGTVEYYMENAKIITEAFKKIGYECYGGENSPYIWVKIRNRSSWEVFQEILDKAHVVITPGVGFGQGGKEFIRVSAFAHRKDVEEGCSRIAEILKK